MRTIFVLHLTGDRRPWNEQSIEFWIVKKQKDATIVLKPPVIKQTKHTFPKLHLFKKSNQNKFEKKTLHIYKTNFFISWQRLITQYNTAISNAHKINIFMLKHNQNYFQKIMSSSYHKYTYMIIEHLDKAKNQY